jgi:hypothetical protein
VIDQEDQGRRKELDARDVAVHAQQLDVLADPVRLGENDREPGDQVAEHPLQREAEPSPATPMPATVQVIAAASPTSRRERKIPTSQDGVRKRKESRDEVLPEAAGVALPTPRSSRAAGQAPQHKPR